MDDQLIPLTQQEIENRIYTIRGTQVMLDKNLAEFYDVKPIRLREQVKRNASRFPEDFMFQLNEVEVEFMVSQNAIPSKQFLGGYLPYVFTEQGVAAISAVLKSERAVQVSIQIVRAFVAMRKFILNNAWIFERLDSLEIKQSNTDTKVTQILDALEKNELKPDKGIFFDGQVFDAYVFVSGLIRNAQKSITLIDNWVDESVLVWLAKRNKGVLATIYTQRITKQLALDLEKYNTQYEPVKVKEFKLSHDRFLIIDQTELYHLGASFKDLGKKWFAFSKMDTGSLKLVNQLNEIK